MNISEYKATISEKDGDLGWIVHNIDANDVKEIYNPSEKCPKCDGDFKPTYSCEIEDYALIRINPLCKSFVRIHLSAPILICGCTKCRFTVLRKPLDAKNKEVVNG